MEETSGVGDEAKIPQEVRWQVMDLHGNGSVDNDEDLHRGGPARGESLEAQIRPGRRVIRARSVGTGGDHPARSGIPLEVDLAGSRDRTGQESKLHQVVVSGDDRIMAGISDGEAECLCHGHRVSPGGRRRGYVDYPGQPAQERREGAQAPGKGSLMSAELIRRPQPRNEGTQEGWVRSAAPAGSPGGGAA